MINRLPDHDPSAPLLDVRTGHNFLLHHDLFLPAESVVAVDIIVAPWEAWIGCRHATDKRWSAAWLARFVIAAKMEMVGHPTVKGGGVR